ncbi:MAG TPA: hypothetical protein VM008_06370 [Phycisphaerae bacterium]|nr:hypothetical protein [Phycisphaerae bacterium]
MKSPLRSNLSIKWIMPPLMVLPVIIVSIVLITLDYQTSRRSIRELADRPARDIQTALYGRVKVYCSGHAIEDDVTFVVIKFTEIKSDSRSAAEACVASTLEGDSP